MSLTHELPADVRKKLEQEAAHRSVEPDDLALLLMREALNNPDIFEAAAARIAAYAPRGPEADAERFRLWANNHRRTRPVIPLEAMSREHIYEDRG